MCFLAKAVIWKTGREIEKKKEPYTIIICTFRHGPWVSMENDLNKYNTIYHYNSLG